MKRSPGIELLNVNKLVRVGKIGMQDSVTALREEEI